MTIQYKRGQQVKVKSSLCRITGETTNGKKSGELYYAVEVANLQVNQWGKKAKVIGWGNAQWVRESLIK